MSFAARKSSKLYLYLNAKWITSFMLIFLENTKSGVAAAPCQNVFGVFSLDSERYSERLLGSQGHYSRYSLYSHTKLVK